VFSAGRVVKVEFAAFVQSTWKAKRSTRSAPPHRPPSTARAKKFGVPAGGARPSTSLGSRMSAGPAGLNDWNVAGLPASICVRSKTTAFRLPPGKPRWELM
jgi:hypothetical protein